MATLRPAVEPTVKFSGSSQAVAQSSERSSKVSQRSDAPQQNQEPVSSARTIHEKVLEDMRKSSHGPSPTVRAHDEIVNAPDDAEWARSMENTLLSLIYARPESNKLEILPTTCRQVGCEIQVLGEPNDAASPPSGGPGGWQAVFFHAYQATRAEWDGSGVQVFVTSRDGRTVYISTLKRRSLSTTPH